MPVQNLEIAKKASRLILAATEVRQSLGLPYKSTGGGYVSGEVRYSMRPQRILPDSDTIHDTYADHVTAYADGHITAQILQHTRRPHQSGNSSLPVPYIPRLLMMKDGVITIDTPTLKRPGKRELVVEEESDYYGRHSRFREVTVIDPITGSISVETGKMTGDGWGTVYSNERTRTDIGRLPWLARRRRLATVKRTLDAATEIFEGVARHDSGVRVTISR